MSVPLIRVPTKEHVESYLSKLSSSPNDTETAKQGIEQFGLVKGLIVMLKKGDKDAITQTITLDTIAEVAKSDIVRQLQLGSELPEIIDTMRTASSPRVREASVIAVSALCENNKQTIKMLLKTKAVNEILAWIQQNECLNLLRLGCLFVESLCNNEKRANVQTAFQRKGALPIIAEQLKKAEDDLVICGLTLAASALVQCIHDDNQQKFRKLKVIPRLVNLLADRKTRQMPIETITTFILELVRGCKKNCERFVSSGLTSILISTIVMEATPLTLFNCQGIIWFCIRADFSIQQEFLQHGLVNKLQMLLKYNHPKIHSGSEKILKELNIPLCR